MTHRKEQATRCVMFTFALIMCEYVFVCLDANLNTLPKTCWTTLYRDMYMYNDSANLAQNVTVSMASSQVEWCIVSPVHHVDAGSSHNEHVHHIGAAFPTRPVQWTESVIISETQTQRSLTVR